MNELIDVAWASRPSAGARRLSHRKKMMLSLKYIPLVWKQVIRHRTRTLLTVAGVATAMFLFTAVQAMQAGVHEATQTTAKDTTLVVYRENRFCPATSRLPEYYGDRIAKV